MSLLPQYFQYTLWDGPVEIRNVFQWDIFLDVPNLDNCISSVLSTSEARFSIGANSFH